MNMKKTKVMVFISNDPFQKFVFKGDIIMHLQTFKYQGILLETTLKLDSVVKHLVAANRCSLFTLNQCYVELHIMDIKLHCDLFNTLLHSIANYAYEIWVDSKKIEAIEIVYRRFFKSDALLGPGVNPLEGSPNVKLRKLGPKGTLPASNSRKG
jgi:hypothetical protein